MRLIIFIFIFTITSYAQTWKNYPYQLAGSDIVFPQDEGKHKLFPKFNLEWWYLVVHGKGLITGDNYSILVSHFNNRIRFFTITNIDKKTHASASAFGKLQNSTEYLDLRHTINNKTDHFRIKKDMDNKLVPFQYEVKTHGKDMQIDLDLDAIKPPLLINGTGYGPVGSSGFTWYYSLSRLNINGKIEYKGIKEPIEGIGWIDHQWGPFVVSPIKVGKLFETYEWFCLQLDNGMDIMVSIIFDRQNRLNKDERYGGINISMPDGTILSNQKYQFKRVKYWKDPVSKKTFSMGWELHIPEQKIFLKLKPTFKEQMVKMILKGDFWEGSMKIDGTIAGKKVEGKGFGELMHEYRPAKLKLWSDKSRYTITDQIKVNWKVLNPDDGNPQKYNLRLIENGKSTLLAKNIKRTDHTFKLKDVIGTNSSNQSFKLELEAMSMDSYIKSSKIIDLNTMN